jgi:hypothetical protein
MLWKNPNRHIIINVEDLDKTAITTKIFGMEEETSAA